MEKKSSVHLHLGTWLHWSAHGWVRERRGIHVTFAEMLTVALGQRHDDQRRALLREATREMVRVGAGLRGLELTQRIDQEALRKEVLMYLVQTLVQAGYEELVMKTAQTLTATERHVEVLKILAQTQQQIGARDAAQVTRKMVRKLGSKLKEERERDLVLIWLSGASAPVFRKFAA